MSNNKKLLLCYLLYFNKDKDIFMCNLSICIINLNIYNKKMRAEDSHFEVARKDF